MANIYRDLIEEISCYEFQKFFYSEYKKSKLDLLSESLQSCLSEVVNKEKPLIFVLYDENNSKSRQLCESLSNPEIENIISEHFLILGWKIKNDQEYCDRLAVKVLIVEEVFRCLKSCKSGIFIIIPNDKTVEVYKTIETDEDIKTDYDSGDNVESNTNNNELFAALTQTQQLLGFYSFGNSLKNLTSTKYQQMMSDELGDRDFDSFEHNEHELLENKILYALYGPPKQQNDNIGYEETQMKKVKKLYETIRDTNNKYSKWKDRIVIAFIYNCTEPPATEKEEKGKKDNTYIPDNDFLPIPIIVLRKCKKHKENKRKDNEPCRIFIDTNGRIYDSWDKYLNNNILPPCKMIYPKNGKYQSKRGSSEVLLDERPSPSCSSITKFVRSLDIGAGIGGFASGIACVAAFFTPAAAITIPAAIATGFSTGVYGVGRSIFALTDRRIHGQSINITNSESRGAYLNIAAGVFSVAGAGVTKSVSTLVRSGSTIGPVVQSSITVINTANVVIGGTAFVNACYDVGCQYYKDGSVPSALTIAQLGSSLFFFGNSVYNFRTGASLVQEMQATQLNEIHDGLRSNRHRKTFNKLLKETVRVKGEAQGRAEVIATLRNPATRDEILAVLTRSNKNFNKNAIRFAAEGKGISFNGVKIDILEFGTLQRTEQNAAFKNFPQIPENHESVNVNKTINLIQNSEFSERLKNLLPIITVNSSMAFKPLLDFTQAYQAKILNICEKFIKGLNDKDIIDILKNLCTDVIEAIVQYVTTFIKKKVNELKSLFESQLLTEEITAVCRRFGFQDHHIGASNFVDLVIKELLNDTMMNELRETFYAWVTDLCYKKEKKIEVKSERHKQNPEKKKKDCIACEGYYYI